LLPGRHDMRGGKGATAKVAGGRLTAAAARGVNASVARTPGYELVQGATTLRGWTADWCAA